MVEAIRGAELARALLRPLLDGGRIVEVSALAGLLDRGAMPAEGLAVWPSAPFWIERTWPEVERAAFVLSPRSCPIVSLTFLTLRPLLLVGATIDVSL